MKHENATLETAGLFDRDSLIRQYNSQIINFKAWTPKSLSRGKVGLAIFLCSLLVSGIIFGVLNRSACAVEVDGLPVAVVKNKAAAVAVVNSLTEEQQRKHNSAQTKQKITYKLLGFKKTSQATQQDLRNLLSVIMTFEAGAAGIKVDGNLIAAVKDRATADQVLKQIRQTYQVEPEYKVSFQQKVDLVDLSVPVNKILSEEQAVRVLKGVSETTQIYTVKEGDSLWSIADAFNITPEELMSVNSGFVPETMQIGQKVKVAGAQTPVLNVLSVGEKTVQESIELSQQVKKNPNLPYGQSRVVQEGQKGMKEVNYQIVLVNGLETQRQVLSQKVIKEAQPRIIEQSSQTMVASRGITRPPGAITSAFGQRWGRLHQGLDIAGNYGDPIRAAGSGQVTRAFWYGSYGNFVEIKHPNGEVTRYAHMSKIKVKAGQTVNKGQIKGNLLRRPPIKTRVAPGPAPAPAPALTLTLTLTLAIKAKARGVRGRYSNKDKGRRSFTVLPLSCVPVKTFCDTTAVNITKNISICNTAVKLIGYNTLNRKKEVI